MNNVTNTQTTEALNAIEEQLADLGREWIGDYYGDKPVDSLADIAKSLRILSGREKL